MENYIINWHSVQTFTKQQQHPNSNTELCNTCYYFFVGVATLCLWLAGTKHCQEVFWMIKVKRILAHTITMIFLYYKLLQPCDNTSKLQIWLWLVLNRYQFFWLVVDNKAIQFESKIITGNGRRQTSTETTCLFCEEFRHSNESSNSRAYFGGNFVLWEGRIVCACVCVWACVWVSECVCEYVCASEWV